MGLIAELKAEHKQIVISLLDIESFENGDVVSSGKIDELDKLLTNHLIKEDEQLYPIIKIYSKLDTSYAESDIGKVTMAVLDFFMKYSGKELDTPTLKKSFFSDFKQLRDALMKRITLEETKIYAEYTKLVID
jgi:hypothetical protein